MTPEMQLTVTVLGFALIIGLLLGSFTNVLAGRTVAGISLLRPPSTCPNCQRRLTPLELVPVFSWIALGGRCRGCRQPISMRYPAVELLVGGLVLLIAWRLNLSEMSERLMDGRSELDGSSPLWTLLQFGLLSVMAVVLTAQALIDLDHYVLNDRLSVLSAALGLGYALTLPGINEVTRNVPGAENMINHLLGIVTVPVILFGLDLSYTAIRRGLQPRRWPAVTLGEATISLTIGGGFGAGALLTAHQPLQAAACAAAGLALGLIASRWISRGRPIQLERRAWAAEAAGLALGLSALIWGATRLYHSGAADQDLSMALRGTQPLTLLLPGLILGGVMILLAAVHWSRVDVAERDDEDFQAIGFGDVKLGYTLGALTGAGAGLAMLMLSVIIALPLSALVYLRNRKQKVPYGPPLMLAAFTVWLLGSSPVGTYVYSLISGQ